jgi:pimeloyl-ACP methyl ester carboxylesterase
MGIVREVASFNKLLATNVGARVATRLDPIDNVAIAAATGAEPLVFTGGIASRASDYLNFQRAWQARGVPTYIVDTGRGANSIRENADEVVRTIERALAETGADRAWVGGQSKGTIDTRWALQHHPELLDQVNGAFLVVGPHHGGLTTNAAVVGAIRGASERLPQGVRRHLNAATELMADSHQLRELNDDLHRFLDEAPDHFVVHNVVTDVMPRPSGLPGHDWFVPLSSQRLGPHSRVIEHELRGGARNHVTAHVNRETRTVMESVMGTRNATLR